MYNQKPNKSDKYHQGNYLPVNRNKFYKFNSEGGIFYRSSWEKLVLIWLDNNPNITLISCEELCIEYLLNKPDKNGNITSSTHKYFVDFYYELKMEDNSIRRFALEVKPAKQTKPPEYKETTKLTKKQLENYRYDIEEWNKNMSKWSYAIKFCEKKGIEFKILTEDQIKRIYIKS